MKEKEEEEAKQVALQAKKEKDIQKKAIKKERQKLRTSCKVDRLESVQSDECRKGEEKHKNEQEHK